MSSAAPLVGLCVKCRWARVTGNKRGSRFYLCGRSKDDPRYPRYPRLPVLACGGFEAAPPDPWDDYREEKEDDDE